MLNGLAMKPNNDAQDTLLALETQLPKHVLLEGRRAI